MPNELFLCFYCILRHLGEFGKIRLLPGGNRRFLPEGGQCGYLKGGL
jgi:hypothetical protein